MAARRDRSTPYELMGGIGRGHVRSPVTEAEPRPEREVDRAGGNGTAGRWWAWSGAGMPILLRVPRGMAVLAALGLLGLILLAFWVGFMQGVSAGEDDAQADLPPRHVPSELASRGATSRPGSTANLQTTPGNNTPESTPAAGTARRTTANGDPRQPGLNYYVLASVYKHADARRLSEFMRTQGVETIVVPRNNEYSYVIAVDMGLIGSQPRNDAERAYKQHLLRAGDAWEREAPEFRDDLDTMYTRRYDGP